MIIGCDSKTPLMVGWLSDCPGFDVRCLIFQLFFSFSADKKKKKKSEFVFGVQKILN